MAETIYPIDPCLNEATPPPTSQAKSTSNIVVSRYGVEERVIDPVSSEVQPNSTYCSYTCWRQGRLKTLCGHGPREDILRL
ncbi:hypothetical protein TNCV_1455961 [Trichonephila clavipes]|nr:hypothetical protein TNCV_1455961 [Trichonephila clavipes]